MDLLALILCLVSAAVAVLTPRWGLALALLDLGVAAQFTAVSGHLVTL